MGTWDPGDPVAHRTIFYERIRQADKALIRFFPFYMVNYPGLPGLAFEPVDCLKRRQLSGDTVNCSAYPKKEVHEVREYDGRTKMFLCQKSPDGTQLTLHALDWDWPR